MIKDGKTYYEIARELDKIDAISNMRRAKMIARTETHTSFMKSLHETVEISDLSQEKEWMTSGDERVRDIHIDAQSPIAVKIVPPGQ